MEMQLLGYKYIDSLTIKSRKSSLKINIFGLDLWKASKITRDEDRYKVGLLRRDIGAISSFVLQYYRDSYAPVSHIHIDVDKKNNIGINGSLTIIASMSSKPIPGEEAKKILGIK